MNSNKSGAARPPRTKSPFFAPSARKPIIRPISTPGGSTRLVKEYTDDETKSSIMGASFNLINAIVGAGIVGIPYALKECSLLLGTIMVLFCAYLTMKSLRLLIATAKHVDVPTYERLAEASFGRPGFVFVSLAMFIMAYGAMLSYLMIIKSSLPRLFGVAPTNVSMARAILSLSSMCIILPLSMQRDIANLSKTSTISVIFDCILVVIVAVFSPVQSSVHNAGGIEHIIEHSQYKPTTFFIGLGVLSFAFVCQHSAFIIAGSLERPTKERWSKVTYIALVTCAILATIMGIFGYLGFMTNTEGNILNNLGTSDLSNITTSRASNIGRGLLCVTMFFVYPVESFVARHICIVLFFKGRSAHDGDDHSVLQRTDRRVALTVTLYLVSLIPALIVEDLGYVLAVTGALGGSSLSYIGPGAAFLGVHGSHFLDIVSKRWKINLHNENTIEDALSVLESNPGSGNEMEHKSYFRQFLDNLLWYVLMMPLWVGIARIGEKCVRKHMEIEATKSPHPFRLGKIIHKEGHYQLNSKQSQKKLTNHVNEDDSKKQFLIRKDSLPLLGTSHTIGSSHLTGASPLLGPSHHLRMHPPQPKYSPKPTQYVIPISLSTSNLRDKTEKRKDDATNDKIPSIPSFAHDIDSSNVLNPFESDDNQQVQPQQIMSNDTNETSTSSTISEHDLNDAEDDIKDDANETDLDTNKLSPVGDQPNSIHNLDESHDNQLKNFKQTSSPIQSNLSSKDQEQRWLNGSEEERSNTQDFVVNTTTNGSKSSQQNILKENSQHLSSTPLQSSKAPSTLMKKSRLLHDQDKNHLVEASLIRADSLPLGGTVSQVTDISPLLSKKSDSPPLLKYGSSKSTYRSNFYKMQKKVEESGEIDPQDDTPSIADFLLAIFFIIFGVIAASAGLFSIFV
eukprot:CAMPEP_0184858172 /NCGR_PEP_ID=MMETSP0580-20130426/3298_1 /TAXON_ID=1118495 /ORGANISM="Dactyliosolen fragilissimus" /LENGTH=905 /DNA_ID=CAMNT_0027354175 /DNA_START=70 /DNA_END=2787 /DNA_ORIENTATION=+